MPASVERHHGPAPSGGELESRMKAAGLSPQSWTNDAGHRYGWHRHPYHKVLYCVAGGIVFHTREDGDLELRPGDRLDIGAGTDHAATVGPDGVRCVEAPRE